MNNINIILYSIINMKIIKLLVILFININNSNCFIHYFVNKYNGFKGLKEIKILNDIDNIKYCSKLSSNVYRDKANITDNKYNTRIKIVEKNKSIYICFRGSTTLKDWETNLDKSLITNYFKNDIYSIHNGYYTRYISISNEIHNYLRKKEFDELYVCGHSLGGALASICCFDLVINNVIKNKKISCITFGSPRIGDINFTKIYNNNKIKTYRIVLSGDPVPKLPLDGNYIHLTSSYYLKNNKIYNKPNKIYIAFKRLITNICDVDFSLKNHSMEKYIETLNRLVVLIE
jgi:hypothetical protein